MDWTGGTRRRYAQTGKNNDVVQKQKAHFAKVRNAGPPLPPSSMPDFMREAVVAKGGYHLSTMSQHGRGSAAHESRGGSRSSTSAAAAFRRRGHAADGRSTALSQHHGSSRRSGLKIRGDMKAASRGSQGYRSQAVPSNNTEEERTLHAARRRLLARSDWLGLSASRPVKMDFPANRCSDRVGTRRKIKKAPHHVSHEVQQRRVTPPFQHRERLLQPVLSDAALDESIDIKVGTGALGSQTHLSGPSHTVAKTSMRRPSTELSLLSEESMLMGEESDNFEVDAVETIATEAHTATRYTEDMQQQSLAREDRYVYASAEQQLPPVQLGGFARGAPYVPSAPVMQRDDSALQADDDYDDASLATLDWETYDPEQPHMETVQPSTSMHMSKLQSQSAMEPTGALDGMLDIEPTASDDEKRWRKALHIRTGAPTEASIAALRSSSLHQAQSTLSYAPRSPVAPDLPPRLEEEMSRQPPDYVEDIFRPVSQARVDEMPVHGLRLFSERALHAAIDEHKGAKPRSASVVDKDEVLCKHFIHSDIYEVTESSLSSVKGTDHDDVRLRRFLHTAIDEDRDLKSPSVSGTVKDDLLWRQFVFGSQGSDSNSSLLEIKVREGVDEGEGDADAEEAEDPPPRSSFAATSDQPRSDQVTTGGSTFKTTLRIQSDAASSTRNGMGNTSLMAHAAAAYQEMDEIEESQMSPPRRRSRNNIHASMELLNAKRFKKGRKQSRPSALPKPSRFVPSAKIRTTAHDKSVYDIPSTSE